MVNPFDKDFFRFLLGFLAIILISLGILYATGKYSGEIDETPDMTASQN